MSFREISPKENKPNEKKDIPTQIETLKGVLISLAFRLGEIMNNEGEYLSKKEEKGDKGGEGDESGNKKILTTRRNFLKTAGIIGAGVVGMELAKDVLKGTGLLHKDYGAGLSDWEMGQGLEGVSGENASEINQSEEPGEKEGIIREGGREINYRQLRQAIIAQYIIRNKVNLITIKEGMKKYWFREYGKNGKQHLGLLQGLERMREWHNEVQKVFDNVFARKGMTAPQWLIYLGIAESHWAVKKGKNSTSWAGAAGVFQLMPDTARDWGLRVNDIIDERYDVIKNAVGAAELLSYLYIKVSKATNNNPETNIDDWNSDAWKLVLALYNGGYVWKFFSWAKKNKKEVSYNSYLQFREMRLNDFLDERLGKGRIIYKVKPGDVLYTVAGKYPGVTVSQLKVDNKLSGNIIKPGQKLIIKLPKKSIEEKIKLMKAFFKKELAGSLENLNYPEKFLGILEAIKKEGLFIEEGDDDIYHAMGELNGAVPILRDYSKKRVK